ncbi:MAG: Mor transcription activator family protein [Candidatus Sedimenticola sp. (ex Thyasira tokunagai)]
MSKVAQGKDTALLADLRDHTVALLCAETDISEEAAGRVAKALVDKIRHHWGGQLIYLPKGKALDIDERDRAMWDDFNGHNHDDLARKYDLTIQGVYQRIRAIRKVIQAETQPDFFDND